MTDLVEPFARMLQDVFAPAAIRTMEHSGDAAAAWEAVEQSGYLDALVPEAADGAGLKLCDVQPLWQALGYYAVPLPVGETMIARALAAEAGLDLPNGPTALATGGANWPVCGEAFASAIVAEQGGALVVRSVGEPFEAASAEGALRRLAALLRASQITGAAARLTEMTAAYASERVQFGKPIGRQQALQQNMAQMAEDMVACRISAQLAAASGLVPSVANVAVAKSISSTAAPRIAATAHAVHGAIGISEEFDLQLYTRRLHEWRWAEGAEGYWNALLGAARLAQQAASVDVVRAMENAEI